jgi:hypothetical protein
MAIRNWAISSLHLGSSDAEVFSDWIHKNFVNISIFLYIIRSVWAPIKPNRDGIQHLSIKEDRNIYEVLIDSIREKTSGSNESICDKCKLDFDKHSGQQTVFEHFKSAWDLFY